MRYLASRGFGVVGEELARSDGIRIARYLATGASSELERVTAYGYDGARRTDRDDSPRGVLADALANQPEPALRAEQTRFAAELRAISRAGEALGFFGFDVDYEPGAGYQLLEELLAPLASPDLGELRGGLSRHPGESLDAEIERLRGAVARLEERGEAVAAALGSRRARELGRVARTTLRSHEYVRIAHAAPRYPALAPALALREELMLEHVEHVLEDLPAGDRMILLSHALHLAKDDARLRNPAAVAGPGGGSRACLGTELCRHHRCDRVFAAWMLEDRGSDARPLAGSDSRIASAPGTLNALLASAGPAFVIPTRSDDPRAELLSEESEIAMMYGGRIRAVPSEQADAICFVRDVTPLRE